MKCQRSKKTSGCRDIGIRKLEFVAKTFVANSYMCRYCATWAKADECKKNPSWMLVYCPVACDQCKVVKLRLNRKSMKICK